MKIYSKITGELLHLVFRLSDFVDGRTEIIDPDNFIQCSALKLEKGHTFKPHRHIKKLRTRHVIAQESWVVISGSVMCVFYDVDDTIIDTIRLEPGDASFTLAGGHTYRVMEDCVVFEMKTGPYEGQLLDKVFI